MVAAQSMRRILRKIYVYFFANFNYNISMKGVSA